MAQHKQEKVHEIRCKNGTVTVRLEGGWVPYAFATPSITAEINRRLSPEFKAKLEARADFHVVFTPNGEEPPSPPGPPIKRKGDSQGSGGSQEGDDGDDYDGDSQSGGGGGDDSPVMHGEFDPWAESISETVKLHQEALESHALELGELGGMADSVTALQRSVNDLARRVSDGNNGGGGSGIVKIIIETPNRKEPMEMEGELFHEKFPRLLKNVAAGCHVYLPGPPGSGKSHAAAQVARALDYRFGSISLGPTTTESRLWGGMTASGEFFEPAFVELARYAMENPDSGAVFCLDEMDNGNAGIIATMNSAMANGFFTAPNGDLINWGRNYCIVAGANTFGTGPTAEFAGRNKLDAATLDRFNYLPWDTDYAMERAIVEGTLHEDPTLAADWLDTWHSARKNVESHGLKVFITMRGAARGAAMLANGDSIYDTLNEVLLFKLPKDQAEKVNPL